MWVHPAATTLCASDNYAGHRVAKLGNTRSLDGYWTTGAFANWQPFAKHLSPTLSVDNRFDADYEPVEGFAAPGTRVLLSAEYRF